MLSTFDYILSSLSYYQVRTLSSFYHTTAIFHGFHICIWLLASKYKHRSKQKQLKQRKEKKRKGWWEWPKQSTVTVIWDFLFLFSLHLSFYLSLSKGPTLLMHFFFCSTHTYIPEWSVLDGFFQYSGEFWAMAFIIEGFHACIHIQILLAKKSKKVTSTFIFYQQWYFHFSVQFLPFHFNSKAAILAWESHYTVNGKQFNSSI